jgi:ankyrin repeat protein
LINAKDGQGETPLHRASRRGQLTVAEFLLASQADVNAQGNSGSTPLHLAASGGHKAMTELLLANGADVNATEDGNGQTALHFAVMKGFKVVAEVLLAKNADVNAPGRFDGRTSLHIAAGAGYKAIAELLLTRGADIHAGDRDDFTPLHVAAQQGQKEVIQLLLARKADVDVQSKDGSTPLNLAAWYGRPEAVQALVAGGADVNHQNSNRITPLHSAVLKKSVEMLSSILARKPNLELRDSERLTPLQRAVLLNEPRLAGLLLSAGANANAALPIDGSIQLTSGGEYWRGQPLLHWAINNQKMVEILLANGADVNVRKSDGQTPLHLAVLYQLKDVTELLLRHGANVNLQDNNGRTPLDLAQPQANVGGRAVRGSAVGVPPGRPRTAADELSALQGNRAFASAPPGTLPAASQPAVASPSEIAQLLKQHGAIEDVQRPLRIGISRKDPAYNAAVFNKGADDSNRFTLFELIASSQAPQVDPNGAAFDPYKAAAGLPNPSSGAVGLPFPDFANMKIHRLEPKGGEREIKVDLNAALESGDCSKDMWLEWGDVVEIPERDHKLNEQWLGLSQPVLDSLQRCVKRTVDIIVKGQSTKVILVPSASSGIAEVGPGPSVNTLGRYARRLQQVVERAPKGDATRNGPTLQNCWLSYVVRHVDVLLSSSDLSRVQVKRVDPVTKQMREFVFNLEQAEPRTDLWLRDGDVIEVPEKQ